MEQIDLVQTKNNILNNDIEEVHKELLEMEEQEMNAACNMSAYNCNKKKETPLEMVQKLRLKSHQLIISAKNDVNTIRCIRLQITDVSRQLKMSKLNKLGRTKYNKKSEEYQTQNLKEKLVIELDYEKSLNKIWFQMFNIYSQLRAAKYKNLNPLDKDYFEEDSRLRESLSNDLEKEGLKLNKLKKKCSQQIDQLLTKCQGIDGIEPMKEVILFDQEKYKCIFQKEDIQKQFKAEIEKVNCSLEEVRSDNEKLLALLEANNREASNMVKVKDEEIERLTLLCQEIEQNNTQLQTQTEELNLQLSQLKPQLAAMQGKQVHKNEELVREHQEIVTLKDEVITKLQSQVRQSRTSVLKLKNQLAEKPAPVVVDELDQKCKLLNAENQELKQKSKKLIKSLNAKGEAERKTKEMLSVYVNQLNVERNEVVQLKERLESKRLELNRRSREMTQSREEVQSLREQMDVECEKHKRSMQMLHNLADQTRALLQIMKKRKHTQEPSNKDTDTLLENMNHIHKNLLNLRKAISGARDAFLTIEQDTNMAEMPSMQEAQNILELINFQDPHIFTSLEMTSTQEPTDLLLDEMDVPVIEPLVSTQNVA